MRRRAREPASGSVRTENLGSAIDRKKDANVEIRSRSHFEPAGPRDVHGPAFIVPPAVLVALVAIFAAEQWLLVAARGSGA
jgi:hypothetical protein